MTPTARLPGLPREGWPFVLHAEIQKKRCTHRQRMSQSVQSKFLLLSRHKTVLKVPCFLLRFYNPQVRHCTAPGQIRIRTYEIEGVSIQAFYSRSSPTSDDRHHPQKRFEQEQGDIDSSISSPIPLWLALPHYVKSGRLHHQGTWPLPT